MIRHKDFWKQNKIFHLNFDFQSTGYFKELDWELLCFSLESLSINYSVHYHCLLMMDTHVHLIFRISDDQENFFTKDLLKKMGLKTQQDYYAEPITQHSQYLNTYKYIYRNPVQAGICDQVQDYPYSSLAALLGKSVCAVFIQDHLGLIQNPQKILNWLNQKDQLFKSAPIKDFRHDNSWSI